MICKPVKPCCIFILLLFLNSFSFAQNNDVDSTAGSTNYPAADSLISEYDIATDTIITRAVFDKADDSILKWKQSREFGYMAYLDSLLHKKTGLKKDTVSLDDNLNSNKKNSSSRYDNASNNFLNSFPVKIFFWIIAVGFIGFILYKLFFAIGLFSKKNKQNAKEVLIDEPTTLNDYSQYNTLIQEAETAKNYNLAIRYLFLQSLKKLSEKELIFYAPVKTNRLYVQELAGNALQQSFTSVANVYEYAWYGKFKIDDKQYRQMKDDFVLFNKRV